jgi:hypothetical protein
MKKYIGLSFVSLFILLFSSSLALAQTDTTTPAPTNTANGYSQQVQAIKQTLKR